MSDTTSNDKTIRVGARKPLSLKRDTDTVRQSFSGGRSKAVWSRRSAAASPGPAKRPELAAAGRRGGAEPAEAGAPRRAPSRAARETAAPPAPRAAHRRRRAAHAHR